MEYVLAWLKQRIERQHRTSKAAGLFAQAEKLLKAHETSRAIEMLRGLLYYFRTSSEEFKALRSILFRLEGAYRGWNHRAQLSKICSGLRQLYCVGSTRAGSKGSAMVRRHSQCIRTEVSQQRLFALERNEPVVLADLDTLLASKPWRHHSFLDEANCGHPQRDDRNRKIYQ